MAKKLYVGNLPFSMNDNGLKELFSENGFNVESAVVIIDRMNNRSKGFGFVEVSEEDLDKAIQALNGKDIEGRAIVVNEARPMEEKKKRSFGGGGGRDNHDRDNRRRSW